MTFASHNLEFLAGSVALLQCSVARRLQSPGFYFLGTGQALKQNFSAFIQTLARLAFAATIFLIPFRFRFVLLSRPFEAIYRDYTDLLLFAADGLMIATLALWFLRLVLTGQRLDFGPFFISIPLAGLTLFAFISSIFSLDPVLALYHSIRLLLLDAFYLYVFNEIRSFTWVGVPLALSILVQAGVGIMQVAWQHSLGLLSLGELELDPAWSGVSVVFADGARFLRAYGLSDHPNILAGCLAFALLFLAIWFLESSPRVRVPTAAVFALGAIALLLTFSRAAYLSMAVGTLFVAIVLWRTMQPESLRHFLLLIVIALFAVLPIALQNVRFLGVRINPQSSLQIADDVRSVAERAALNETANQVFANNPLAGVGIGALPQAVRQYHPTFDFYYQPAHIALLDAAAETGIFGALFYFALMVAPWLALASNRTQLTWTPHLLGISAILLAVTLVGFFDYYTWLLVPGRLWQGTIWGLWGIAYREAFTQSNLKLL